MKRISSQMRIPKSAFISEIYYLIRVFHKLGVLTDVHMRAVSIDNEVKWVLSAKAEIRDE